MGIGGGFFMTFVDADGTAYALNAREQAPSYANPDMYGDNADLAQTGQINTL